LQEDKFGCTEASEEVRKIALKVLIHEVPDTVGAFLLKNKRHGTLKTHVLEKVREKREGKVEGRIINLFLPLSPTHIAGPTVAS